MNTATPATYYVHTDHLHRPIRLSNAAKAFVWSAEYQPWGAVQSLSGPLTMDLRFPGQWFQLEAGLHYNWHRHYDASLGRYTQPDPLGFVDGASVYGYARNSPYRYVDPDGRNPAGVCALVPAACITPIKVVIEACTIIGVLIQNKSITCTAKCNVQQIDPAAVCPDRVNGEATGKNQVLACKAAQKDANSKVPRGCYKRHCDCDCK